MLSAIKLYFQLVWLLKTPFILLLDARYKPLPYRLIREICESIGLVWGEDFSDCDDFAWLFKAEATKRGLNGVGFIIGKIPQGGHAWNVVLTIEAGLCQVEPQTGMVFNQAKEYRPRFVIM